MYNEGMNPTRLFGVALAAVLLAARHSADPLIQLRELPAPALAGAGQHNLAVAPDGRVILSWVDVLPDTSYALRMSVLGGEWSRPRTIAQGRDWFINWADFPAIAVTDRVMVAHWLERNAPRSYAYGIRLSRSTDGGATWSAAVKPHRETVVHGPQSHAYYGFVSLWPMPDGTVGAAWTDSRNTGDTEEGHGFKNLRVTTWAGTGGLGPEIEVDDGICDCCQTAAAVTSDGPVVVYRDRTPNEIRDIAIVRQVNGAWTPPAIVSADNWNINACPVNGPAVAAEGRLVAVAWYTAAGGTRRVKVAFSADAGATFGAPLHLLHVVQDPYTQPWAAEAFPAPIGDLLFEGVFLAQICAEDGDFTVADSLEAITDKLIRRHPHVFGQARARQAMPRGARHAAHAPARSSALTACSCAYWRPTPRGRPG